MAICMSSPPPPAPPDATTGDAAAVASSVSTPPRSPAAPQSVVSQRPPLARRPRGGDGGASRSGGVRRRLSSGAAASADENDSGAASSTALSRTDALRECLSLVADEIRSLVDVFHVQPAYEQRFATFKLLWLERRLSAMFHVEFWDSSPSDTHHAVLQTALELLVDAVDDARKERDGVRFGKVIGYVFALYCAFSVQVSKPKIKIQVDPSMWLQLLQLRDLLAEQLESVTAAREALAMLRRLEHDDNAFLKCLGGAMHEFHVQRRRSVQPLAIPNPLPVETIIQDDNDSDEKQEMVMRLDALSTHYNATLKALAQTDVNGDDVPGIATASNGAGRGGRGRGRGTPSFLRRSRPTGHTDNGLSGLMRGLWNDSRVSTSDAWIAQLQQAVVPSQHEDTSNHGLNGVDVDSTWSGSASQVLDDDDIVSDMDATLLALEQELVRDETLQLEGLDEERNTSQPQPSQRAQPSTSAAQELTRRTRALSFIFSGQDTDGLDELEAELVQDISATKDNRINERSATKVTHAVTSATKKLVAQRAQTTFVPAPKPQRGRTTIPTVSSTGNGGLDEWASERAHNAPTVATGSLVTRQRNVPNPARDGAPSTAHRTRAPSVASTAGESDGLAELEAELMLGEPRVSAPQRTDNTQSAVAEARLTRSRAASIASSGYDSDGLDDLSRELSVQPRISSLGKQVPKRNATLAPRQTSRRGQPAVQDLRDITLSEPRVSAPLITNNAQPAAVEPRLTRSRASSIASSGYETDGLADLSRELSVQPQIPSLRKQVPTRNATLAPRQNAQSRRTSPTVQDVTHPTLSEPRVLAHRANNTQPTALEPRLTRSRAASIASSGYETDGLDDLNREVGVRPQTHSLSLQAPTRNSTLALRKSAETRRTPPDEDKRVDRPAAHESTSRMSSRSSDVGSVDELVALQRELDAAEEPHPTNRGGKSRTTATPQKRRAPSSAPSLSRQRKKPTPAPKTGMPVPPSPTPRRSRRLSIASSARTDTDPELAALDAELNTAPRPTNQSSAQEPLDRQALHQPRLSGSPMIGESSEEDEELKELQAELAANAGRITDAPVRTKQATVSAKAPAKPKAKQPRKASKPKDTTLPKKAQSKPRKPRQPRQPKTPKPSEKVNPASIVPGVRQPMAAPKAPMDGQPITLSSRRSVASSYDSDGLDELDQELAAFR